jgi:cobalt/nickel transport system permease protein
MARFLEKTLASLSLVLERSLVDETWSRRRGLLQSADPRLKILLLLSVLLLCSFVRRIEPLVLLYVAALLLAMLSKIDPRSFTKRVWIFIPAFSGLIALPALFLTAGTPLLALGPAVITKEGATTAALLVLRVSASVSYTLLFVLTTPWNEAMQGLKDLRIPATAVCLLAVSYRYLLLLVRTFSELLIARKSRTVGRLPHRNEVRFISRSAGFLFLKSLHLAEGVHMAMISRGYEDGHMRREGGGGSGDA